jgi:hypothetical protein
MLDIGTVRNGPPLAALASPLRFNHAWKRSSASKEPAQEVHFEDGRLKVRGATQ